MARLLGVVDRPGGRRLNRGIVPRLGGLALFFGIFVPALAFLDLSGETRGLLLGAAVATTIGAIDDFRGLRWWEKLGGQVAAAAIPVGFGIWVHRFTFPIIGIHDAARLGRDAAVRPLDRRDHEHGQLPRRARRARVRCLRDLGVHVHVIALSLPRRRSRRRSCRRSSWARALGFLRHNVYPARIFMGDSGAMLLGFVLAAIPLQGLLKTASIVTLFFPLLVLAVPIIDTSFVVAKRLKYRQPVYVADRQHLHHRFVNIGFSQRRAAGYIWLWCGTLAATALALRFIRPHQHGEWHLWRTLVVALFGLTAVAASVYMVYLLEIVKLANPMIRRREEQARARRSQECLTHSRPVYRLGSGIPLSQS